MDMIKNLWEQNLKQLYYQLDPDIKELIRNLGKKNKKKKKQQKRS